MMIIPSIIAQIIYFFNDKDEISNVPKEGFNNMLIRLDNGNSITINISSNDREMNSLFQYLHNKASKNVKEDKVKTGALDLTYIDATHPYYPYLQKEIEKIKLEKTNLSQPQLMKEATYNLSKKIHYKRTLAQKDSIIRLPLAISMDKNGNVKHNARAIIVERTDQGNKVYSTKGIYMYASKPNHIPIEITPIFNRENNFTGLFKIETSILINKKQIIHLLEHQIRTIEKAFQTQKKPFLMGFNYNHYSLFKNVPDAQELIQLYNSLNQIYIKNRQEKENNLPKTEYEEYISGINALIRIFEQDSKNVFTDSFKANLPMMYEVKDMQSALYTINNQKGKSPLQTLSDSIINLNFSKENPSVKELLRKTINNYLDNIVNGNINSKIIGTLFLPAVDIFGKNYQSWGFLKNNIDSSRFVLSIDDSYNLINYLSQLPQSKSGSL